MGPIDRHPLREAEFQFIGSQVQYYVRCIPESFSQFIKLAIAIVGGSIWLSLQPGIGPREAAIFWVLSALLMFLQHLEAWHGYRYAQSRVSGLNENGVPNVPPPRANPISRQERWMIAAMWLLALIYGACNPFMIKVALSPEPAAATAPAVTQTMSPAPNHPAKT
jgi:hypothetical protein